MEHPVTSVVIPAYNERTVITETIESLSHYFDREKMSYELLVVSDGSTDGTDDVVASLARENRSIRLIRLDANCGKGAAVRRGVAEARGSVIAFTDADLPYRVENLGQAIDLVRSEQADIAIGARDLPDSQADPSYPAIRKVMGRTFSLVIRVMLVRNLFDTQCGLKAFRAEAAKLLFSRSRLSGFSFDFEVLYLAWVYGFRIEKIPVGMSHRHESKVRLVRDSLQMLGDVFRVRGNASRGLYGEHGGCPVCASRRLRSLVKIGRHLVRECRSCRSRFLSRFPSPDELETLYNTQYFESDSDLLRGYAACEGSGASARMADARAAQLAEVLQPGAAILEIGAGTGTLGARLARDYRYSAVELSEAGAETLRRNGLEVECTSLEELDVTGRQFDAVVMVHLFEHLADPHSALRKVRQLLAPNGILFLVTPDTRSLLAAISGSRWVSYKFPEHLILYSGNALHDLLSRSGFDIVSASSDYEYHDRDFIVSRLRQLNGVLGSLGRALLRPLPKVLPVTSGSVRMIARLSAAAEREQPGDGRKTTSA